MWLSTVKITSGKKTNTKIHNANNSQTTRAAESLTLTLRTQNPEASKIISSETRPARPARKAQPALPTSTDHVASSTEI